MTDQRRQVRRVLGGSLGRHPPLAGYLLIAFITTYGTRTLKLSTATMLLIGIAGAVSWGFATLLAARWSDPRSSSSGSRSA